MQGTNRIQQTTHFSLSTNTQATANASRVSDSQSHYGLYMQNIICTLFKRSSINFPPKITSEFLFYWELRSILIFKLVSRELFYLSFIIEIDVPLKPPVIREKSRVIAQPITITKAMINKLPLYSYQGAKVISSPCDIKEAVSALANESILGFDTETRPAFQKGVSYLPSLIQLASQDKVFIFQLHLIKDLTLFAPLFENAKIIKTGVGIQDDLKQLQKLGHFKPTGFVEISRLQNCQIIHNKGLCPLAAYFLGVRIAKRQQLSNWAKPDLTKAQINYAATDAWISREIYLKLTQPSLTDESYQQKTELTACSTKS